MKPLARVDFIVVHCSATKSSMNVTVDDLRKWHVEENGWSDIGYHHFIKFDGTVHDCRPIHCAGAHCPDVNSNSIAICIEGGYKGEGNFTDNQLYALFRLIGEIKERYSNAAIVGHSHFDNNKDCPSFEVVTWYESMLKEGF